MRHALAVLLTVVTATLCAVALLVFPGSAAAAGVGGTTLEPGQTMKAGDFLTIPSGAVQLVMQSDGNLVEYVYNGSSRSNERTALWSTQTAHHPGAVFKMQTDGNAVVYLGSKALWNTHTAHNPGARLVLQNDFNVVVYSTHNAALWAVSRSYPNLRQRGIRGGEFCSPEGAVGYTNTGATYVCTYYPSGQDHWKAVQD